MGLAGKQAMRAAIVITLHAVFVQASPPDGIDLQDVVLGKPGQLTIRARASPAAVSRASFLPPVSRLEPSCTSLKPLRAGRLQRPFIPRGAGVVARGYLDDW